MHANAEMMWRRNAIGAASVVFFLFRVGLCVLVGILLGTVISFFVNDTTHVLGPWWGLAEMALDIFVVFIVTLAMRFPDVP